MIRNRRIAAFGRPNRYNRPGEGSITDDGEGADIDLLVADVGLAKWNDRTAACGCGPRATPRTAGAVRCRICGERCAQNMVT